MLLQPLFFNPKCHHYAEIAWLGIQFAFIFSNSGDSLVMIAQDESFLMPDMAFGKAEWGLKYDTPKGSPKLASLQSQPPETGLDVGNRFFKVTGSNSGRNMIPYTQEYSFPGFSVGLAA